MTKRVRTINRTLSAAALILSCSVLSATADPYATAILADHPAAFWQLNETSGTVVHDSAGTFNGIYTNALIDQPGYTAGSDPAALAVVFGSSAGFNQDSYAGGMALDVATNGNATFSAEAWVNGFPQSAGAGIIGKGPSSGEEFYLDCGGSQNGFRFFVRNAAGTAFSASSSFVPDGNWHHLVGVCDEVNSNLSLYIDGLRLTNVSVSGGIRTSVNLYMNIGSRQGAASGPFTDQFNGSISDVAVYNYALSSAQVQNHYFAAGIPPTITVQAPGSVTANEGGAVTVSATIYGSSPLSYQWSLNSTPLAGQTNATFFTGSIPASYNGNYLYLTVTNAYGTVTDAGTYLTVNSGTPQIISDVQPSQLTLYTGNTFTYSVGVQGTAPFYYQWLNNGLAIAGATNSTYVATASSVTSNYSVTISNSLTSGGSPTTSSTASLVGVALPGGTYASKVLSDQPVAYWRLDDATNSTVAAEYVGGHVGTYNNVQLGVPGYSPSFDPDTAGGFGILSPTDSYMTENDQSASGIPLINFAEGAGTNAEFSVEAWVKGPAGQNSAGSAIVAKGTSGSDAFVLDASGASGNFRFYTRKPVGGTSIINSSTAPDGNWHHLVGVCDEANSATTLYVDGINTGQITGLGATGLFNSTGPLSIGAQNSGGDYNYQFIGTIDEVSVYNYALTPAQVAAHYNAAPLPPYFTLQPSTNVLAYLGQPVTLSAAVLGSAPLTNQWYSNNIALAGQTNISLSVNTSRTGTNTYTLKVSNAYGSITNSGSLVQIPAGSGPPQLLSDITPVTSSLYANQPLTFSVTASGSAPLSYQWWFNSAIIPGATSASYAISNLQPANAGSYYVVVSNSISTIQSSTSVLTVIPSPTNVYPLTVLLDHPVAYYRLDEAVGSSVGYDYVGGNNGQYTALAQNQLPLLGVPGYNSNYDSDTACRFGTGGTGVFNNYLGNTITNIDFARPNGQSGAFTLEAWVNGTTGISQVGGACIVAKGAGGFEQFALDVNNGFRFYVRNAGNATLVNAQASPLVAGSEVSGAFQMDGKWHHVVGVCDQVNSNLLLYVDGLLIGPNVITNGVVPKLVYGLDVGHPSNGTNGAIAAGAGINESATSSTNSNENSVTMGNRNKSTAHTGTGAYDLPFVGGLDEVAIYGYALTPAQIYSHYAVAQGLSIPLTLQTVGGSTMLTWTTAASLQSATSLSGPWTTVAGATSPYTITTTGAQQFYRLKIH